jgi:hypothetical protein
MIRARRLLTIIVLATACALRADAQQTHVLIVTGLGAEPQFATRFHTNAMAVHTAAKTKWGVAPASLVYLAEDPSVDKAISGKSTKDEIAAAFAAFAKRAAPGDIVLVFLLGHGSGEGVDSRVSLPGPDATAGDYATWLSTLSRQTIVFVNASSASGDFIKPLAGPGRVIVTATRTAMERNESVFSTHFANGLATGEADADKDARTSVLEAFEYAKKEVARSYESQNKLLTEHAALSDSMLARTVNFGGVPVSNDPRVAALVAERQALEAELATLRSKKADMNAADYEKELERLLVAIAEKTQAIKAAGGRQ